MACRYCSNASPNSVRSESRLVSRVTRDFWLRQYSPDGHSLSSRQETDADSEQTPGVTRLVLNFQLSSIRPKISTVESSACWL